MKTWQGCLMMVLQQFDTPGNFHSKSGGNATNLASRSECIKFNISLARTARQSPVRKSLSHNPKQGTSNFAIYQTTLALARGDPAKSPLYDSVAWFPATCGRDWSASQQRKLPPSPVLEVLQSLARHLQSRIQCGESNACTGSWIAGACH